MAPTAASFVQRGSAIQERVALSVAFTGRLAAAWASGSGVVVGTFTTNGVGNGTFHVNTQVSPGFHTVAIDVTRAGSGADVYVTAGLYEQNLWLYFQ